MNYSPIFDQLVTYGLIVLAVAVLGYELLTTLYWRRVAELLRGKGGCE